MAFKTPRLLRAGRETYQESEMIGQLKQDRMLVQAKNRKQRRLLKKKGIKAINLIGYIGLKTLLVFLQ